MWIMPMDVPEVIDVLTSMHGGHGTFDHVVEQRKMKAVEVEMQNVEIACTLPNLGQHGEMGRNVPG
jgi:hypothetical protein